MRPCYELAYSIAIEAATCIDASIHASKPLPQRNRIDRRQQRGIASPTQLAISNVVRSRRAPCASVGRNSQVTLSIGVRHDPTATEPQSARHKSVVSTVRKWRSGRHTRLPRSCCSQAMLASGVTRARMHHASVLNPNQLQPALQQRSARPEPSGAFIR